MRIVMKAYKQNDVIELLRRKAAGKTQRAFAEEVGISQQYLCDLLQGRRTPGPAVLEYLGLEPAFIPSEQRA